MDRLFLLAVVLVALVFAFRHLFRTLDFSRWLVISRREWRAIRRNKLVPYYVLFVVFVTLMIGGAIWRFVEITERVRP